jgi:protein-S-isoprenylcysteine O-methyltransferase Ste14
LEYLYLEPLLPREDWVEAIGGAVVLVGLVLFLWARYVARLFYSAELLILEAQQLIRGGPYAIIRHPAYAGFLVVAVGVAVGYSSVAGILSVLILLVPELVYRIHRDDHLLALQFGGRFERYASSTARLIPHIW